MTVAIIDARERQYVVLAQGAEIVGPLAQQATSAAARAELAEIGAVAANGGFYATTAAGIAATNDGEFFTVPGDGTNTYAVLYRNDSGTATEIAEYQSKTAFDAALADLETQVSTSSKTLTFYDADPATAIATAATTVAPNVIVPVPSPASIGTAPTYPDGQRLVGAPLYWDAGGGLGRQMVNLWGRDRATHFGLEYLFRFHFILESGLPVKIALIGDSNTAGYAGPILQALLDALPDSTVQNFAVGGTFEDEWFNETGVFATGQPYESSNYSAVKAFSPDLLINGYAFTNDPAFGRTVDQAIATKRAFLSDYRDLGGGQPGARGGTSILQMTANAQRNGANGRDEFALAEFNARLRTLCDEREYEVAFFDKNAVMPNGSVDVGVGGMENRHIDAAGVHTTFAHSRILAHAIYEFLVPTPYRPIGGNGPLEVVPASGLTQPASEKMRSVPTGGPGITGKGYLAVTTPAPLTAGQAIGTIAEGHRPGTALWGIPLEIFDSFKTPPFESIRGNIGVDGTITTRTASTYDAERVYLNGSWVTLA